MCLSRITASTAVFSMKQIPLVRCSKTPYKNKRSQRGLNSLGLFSSTQHFVYQFQAQRLEPGKKKSQKLWDNNQEKGAGVEEFIRPNQGQLPQAVLEPVVMILMPV